MRELNVLATERIAKPNKYTSRAWVDDQGYLVANQSLGPHQRGGMSVVWLRVWLES